MGCPSELSAPRHWSSLGSVFAHRNTFSIPTPSSNPSLQNQEIFARHGFWSVEVIQRFCCFGFFDPLQGAYGILRLQATLWSEVHNPALKFCMVWEFSHMHLPRKITRIYHATLSTSPDTRGMVSHRLKTIAVVQTFSFTFPEKQCKKSGCNGFSLPLFSIPSLSMNPHDVVKFLETSCNSSVTRRASWQSKTLPGKLTSPRVSRCILESGTRCGKGLMRNVSTAKTARWVRILDVFESSTNSNPMNNWHSDQFHCARAVAQLRANCSVYDGGKSVDTVFWSVPTPSLWWRQPARSKQKLSQIWISLKTSANQSWATQQTRR